MNNYLSGECSGRLVKRLGALEWPFQVNGIGAKMSDVANSTNQIQFCLFASGGEISAPATRSLFTFPMNSTLNFPPLTGTHDATRKANLP